ncbi:Right handed beta helix region containing protein [Novymonas esmeraldas]|uniref:Right handed beta helix region containing protein n=1 Tax=Novymonas esmeraldas TaxID=1808958 RepID=A0AAW0ENT5_9TRYP
MEVRDERVQLYPVHNPRRLEDVDETLRGFKGRERAMLTALREPHARNGASANSSFAGASSAVYGVVGGAHTPAAAVTAADSPPPLMSTTGASAMSSAGGDPGAAAAPAAATAARDLRPRQCEMQELVRQMRSVDVRRLADRVGALAAAAAAQPSRVSRVPRLQWRRGGDVSSSASTAGAEEEEGDGDELQALLRHIAVFLHHVAECADRFLRLAEDETRESAAAAAAAAAAAVVMEAGEGGETGGDRHAAAAAAAVAPSRGDRAERDVVTAAAAAPRSPDAPHRSRLRRRPSCVRGVRSQTAAVSVSPTTATTATSPRDTTPPTSTKRRGGRVDSSPPTYRAATVSPLTTSSPRTPSPPAPPHFRGAQRALRVPAATAARGADAEAARRGAHTLTAPCATSPPPSPPATAPPVHGGALVLRSPPPPPTRRRVVSWTPSSPPSELRSACASLRHGDCVVLEPGVYHAALVLEDCGCVELASAYPGAAVVLRPSSEVEPVLSVRGSGSRVELRGIVLVQGGGTEEAEAAAPPPRAAAQVPLLCISDGAAVRATAAHFYGGIGGGVVVTGAHSHATLDLCLVSLCSFAGVFARDGASVRVERSKIKKSEAGVRVLQASALLQESTVEDCRTDGVVVYQGGLAVVERCGLANNGGNGVFLDGAAEARVTASTIELNAIYGVQRHRGSSLHVRTSHIRDNGLLPISDEGV